MSQMSSLLAMNPQKRQVSAPKSWREEYGTHLASKGSQAGLQEEAQSSLRDEAGWQRALYG